MIIKSKKIKDVVFFKNISFKDNRGYFKELLKEKDFKKKFPFLVMSFSKKNVIRGLHLQTKNSQGKFVSVIKGEIFDVVVDLRKKEKTFGKWAGVMLNEVDNKMLYVPEGFAHGFLSLSDKTELLYKCSTYFNKDAERTLYWSDNTISISWPSEIPISSLIISEKDRKGLSLNNLLELDELF